LAAGKPSGIFVDAASNLVGQFVPTPKPLERDIALGEAQRKLHSLGITTIADMGTSMDDWQSYRRAGDAGWLTLRIIQVHLGKPKELYQYMTRLKRRSYLPT
jgi:predicted amidohydrolase YtcJ